MKPATDGTRLEELVRQIEEFVLPAGCKVEARKRTYTDAGAPLAEFDVVINGRFGSTDINWLIECRDRPSEGPGPAAWIEQLVGRRQIHKFSRVTAVTTGGFSDGSIAVAAANDIELRTVHSVSAQEVADWLKATTVRLEKRIAKVLGARALIDPGVAPERVKEAEWLLRESKGSIEVLRLGETGRKISIAEAFQRAVDAHGGLFEGIVPDDLEGRLLELQAPYPDADGELWVDTHLGGVQLCGMRYTGRLLVRHIVIPLGSVKEYKRDPSGALISQTAEFPVNLKAGQFAFEVHHLAELGEIRVVLKKADS